MLEKSTTIPRSILSPLFRELPPLPLLALLFVWLAQTTVAVADGVPWRPWGGEVVAEARAQGRPILVSGSSKACPWCRKMDEGTFKDAAVQKLIVESFIPVRVNLRDSDEVPPRFQNFQPPTLLVLGATDEELFFHHGYLEAEELADALRRVLAEISHGDGKRVQRIATPSVNIDASEASFNGLLMKARDGDTRARAMALRTLTHVQERRDAVWGGVFSLEDGSSYKKFLVDQIRAIEFFLAGGQAFGDGDYSLRARETSRYVMRFLGEKGLLSEEQDDVVSNRVTPREYFNLDDERRRSLGVPKVSKWRSISNSARMVSVLADLYGVTGEREFLKFAEQLSSTVGQNRERQRGEDVVRDSASIAKGFLSLYSVTAERGTLKMSFRALEPARAIFRSVGSASVSVSDRAFFAEVANLLARYTGDEALSKESRRALDGVGKAERDGPRVVEARWELEREPIHIVVVGSKGDSGAQALWSEAIRLVYPYLRREWLDRAEGPLPNSDVSYPNLTRPAAFLCFQKRCSLPLFTQSELRAKLQEVVPPI